MLISPTTVPICWGGYARETSVMPSPGIAAPPADWMTRATIRSGKLGASTQSSEPTAKTACPATKKRRAPKMSASRPKNGIATA